MEGTMVSIAVKDGDYTDGQKTLISLWEKHINQVAKGFPDIGIMFTLPRYKKGERKRFNGFKIMHHTVTSNGRDLVRMSTEDFILMMAKSGINIEVEKGA